VEGNLECIAHVTLCTSAGCKFCGFVGEYEQLISVAVCSIREKREEIDRQHKLLRDMTRPKTAQVKTAQARSPCEGNTNINTNDHERVHKDRTTGNGSVHVQHKLVSESEASSEERCHVPAKGDCTLRDNITEHKRRNGAKVVEGELILRAVSYPILTDDRILATSYHHSPKRRFGLIQVVQRCCARLPPRRRSHA
jgi:hypothetical protein